ncbi:MAG TPA: hypothetical protein VE078_09280 [Thermoanaerobaculia bacterium]|nr:hypothetical protein [Thermoanaerobaculia bacterium]
MEPTKTPAAPFHPGEPRRTGPSRTRPLLIGCGVVLVLLGIGAIVLVVKLPELVDWMFHQLESQVMAKLPPDITLEERQRLDAAFDAAAGAIGERRANQAKAEELNAVLMEFARAGRTITREDVLELTRALEETAGKAAHPDPPNP